MMGDVTTVSEAGDPATGGYTILVAVDRRAHLQQLLRTATDIARQEGGTVHVVSVVAKGYDSPFGVFDDETIREEFPGDRQEILEAAVAAGEDRGVAVSGQVVVDRSVHRGIRDTAAAVDADAILVGWTTRTGRTDALLGTNVDALIERTPRDVFVERIGPVADGVERVLVPVAGGPHAALAADAGRAIATANDAELSLLSITGADSTREIARERLLRTARELELGARLAVPAGEGQPAVTIEADDVTASTVAHEDVLAGILEATGGYDVVILGATRGGQLRARLVGSIPRAVAARTDRTVVLARKWTGPSRLARLLGRVRRS